VLGAGRVGLTVTCADRFEYGSKNSPTKTRNQLRVKDVKGSIISLWGVSFRSVRELAEQIENSKLKF
jgi:hypothetical protein